MKKQLLLLVMMLLPMVAMADAVEIDGIYYNLITKGKIAEVTSSPNYYSGSVAIPEKVQHEGTEYSVTRIAEGAFCDCWELTSITIPNSVTSIGIGAFDDSDLSEVISEIENPFKIDGKYSEGPPTFSSNTFNNATLYVPVGTINKYKAAIGWKEFVFIKEGAPSGISNIKDEGVKETKRFTLDGRAIKNSHKGLNIIKMDDGTTKKVIVK